MDQPWGLYLPPYPPAARDPAIPPHRRTVHTDTRARPGCPNLRGEGNERRGLASPWSVPRPESERHG
ncbi:hypothetical protein LZ31DRAFT_333689 [Colletotrichum somersetense]|nr:hypothetical protein LZ31DRAFT_333689 [Colletotrichum somersetense]